MAAPYIPARDALFADWLNNFATLIAASPTSYGLLAGDATAISAQNTAFQTAYSAAINPTTRTGATIAAKDAARANAEAVVRPYAQRIRNNTAVSNALKIGLGLTIPSYSPTPIPAPSEAPTSGLKFAIPGQTMLTYKTPGFAGKNKPYGSTGVEVYLAVGAVPAVGPAAATYFATFTKSPFAVEFEEADKGKVATVFQRFVTRSGPSGRAQRGPFSAPLSFNII